MTQFEITREWREMSFAKTDRYLQRILYEKEHGTQKDITNGFVLSVILSLSDVDNFLFSLCHSFVKDIPMTITITMKHR